MNKLKVLFLVAFVLLTIASVYAGLWANAVISFLAVFVWVWDIRKELKKK